MLDWYRRSKRDTYVGVTHSSTRITSLQLFVPRDIGEYNQGPSDAMVRFDLML